MAISEGHIMKSTNFFKKPKVCEACGKKTTKLIDFNLYWVCDTDACKTKAKAKADDDVGKYGEVRPTWINHEQPKD